MCGIPGQTEEQIDRDIDYAKRLIDLAPGRMEVSMVPLCPLPGTPLRDNASAYGLTPLDPEFKTDRLQRGVFSETETMSAAQIEHACARFNAELLRYTLERGSSLGPQGIKELVVQAADLEARTLLINALCQFDHVSRLLHLRRRPDHRFLFEIRTGLEICFPQRIKDNQQ